MYDTLMIKDLENKFQSAALAELLNDPSCMLGLQTCLKTWKVVDEMLRAEKAAYDVQYAARLEAFKVEVPAISYSGQQVNWASILIVLGLLGVGAYVVYKIYKSLNPATASAGALKDGMDALSASSKSKDKNMLESNARLQAALPFLKKMLDKAIQAEVKKQTALLYKRAQSFNKTGNGGSYATPVVINITDGKGVQNGTKYSYK